MSRKGSMMGSSKYELDPNGLERDVKRKEEAFKGLYAEIKQLIIDNSIIYQIYYGGTIEGFYEEVAREFIKELRGYWVEEWFEKDRFKDNWWIQIDIY